MAYRIIRPATHEEWLEERKKGIGSSDAGTIMGVSPFSTPRKLYEVRKGLRAPDPENDAMAEGHILEPAIAEWFAWKTGNIVDVTSEGDWMAVDTERDYLRVSPDRLWWPKGTPAEGQTLANARILEIKRTGKAVYKDDLPDYWYCQIQYQMGIMGVGSGALCWLSFAPGANHFDYVEIDFNPPFFDELIKRIDRFWHENLLAGICPPDINADDVLRSFPEARKGSEAEATENDHAMWKALKECRSQLKELGEREETLTDALKMATGGCEALVFTDRDTGEVKTLATWKNSSRTVFDEDTFKADRPDLWDRYTSTQTTVTLDARSLQKDEPEVYGKYATKTAGARKFLLK